MGAIPYGTGRCVSGLGATGVLPRREGEISAAGESRLVWTDSGHSSGLGGRLMAS